MQNLATRRWLRGLRPFCRAGVPTPASGAGFQPAFARWVAQVSHPTNIAASDQNPGVTPATLPRWEPSLPLGIVGAHRLP